MKINKYIYIYILDLGTLINGVACEAYLCIIYKWSILY
jgi:hypothetical protein